MLQKTYQIKKKPPEWGKRGLYQEKGLLYRLPSRKAFPHLGLCAGKPRMRIAKSCIKL
jgi:hypothetical protein